MRRLSKPVVPPFTRPSPEGEPKTPWRLAENAGERAAPTFASGGSARVTGPIDVIRAEAQLYASPECSEAESDVLPPPPVAQRQPDWSGPTPLSVTPVRVPPVAGREPMVPFVNRTPAAQPAISPLTPSARATADALESVAAKIRRGDLRLMGQVRAGDEPAALAAVLATLLGVRNESL